MLTGVGAGFSEALLNPLIVETHPRQSGKYLNIGHAFYPMGVMTSALLFGELLTLGVSWRLIFQIAAVGALAVAILFSVLRFPPQVRDNSSYPKLFAGILSMRGFWIFAAAIFLGTSIESAFTFWSRSYVGFYLSDVPRSGALAVVIFAASMAVGRFLAAFLANRTSLSNIMIGSGLLGIAVSLLIPSAGSLASFYALLALAGLATACYWPTIMAEADDYLGVNPTILFILLACAGIIGFGLAPFVLGWIGDTAGLRAGFAIIPLLFIALVGVLLLERRLSVNREQVPVTSEQ
jgi:fucose permease